MFQIYLFTTQDFQINRLFAYNLGGSSKTSFIITRFICMGIYVCTGILSCRQKQYGKKGKNMEKNMEKYGKNTPVKEYFHVDRSKKGVSLNNCILYSLLEQAGLYRIYP